MTTDKLIGIIKSHKNHCGEQAIKLYSLGYETAVCNIIRDINGAIQRELNGEMTELGERNFALIMQAVKDSGSYDPNEILCYFEEQLYVHEADTIVEFLEWVVNGEYELKHGYLKAYERAFGHGNYEQRFQEFLNQR